MASSETDTGADTRERSGPAGAGGEQPGDSASPPAASPGEERPTRRFRGSGVSAAERARMLNDLRRIEFPAALRGYDRAAVDRYVEHVNRLIAELEISASPESAVRHALDEVSEETRGLLQRAHQTAGEIMERARAKADEQLEQARLETQEAREAAAHEAAESRDAAAREAARVHAAAQREADELRENARREKQQMLEEAEGRERELARSMETIWRERRRLIEDVRTVGDQLVAIGETEAKRFVHFPGEAGFAEDDTGGET